MRDMLRINVSSYELLLSDAHMVMSRMIQAAKEEIDAQFGEGYAASNPTLVGNVVSAGMASYDISCKNVQMQNFGDAVELAGSEIAGAISENAKAFDRIATQIKWLGTGDAGPDMGAIEYLGTMVKQAGESVASSLAGLSEIAEELNGSGAYIGDAIKGAASANVESMRQSLMRPAFRPRSKAEAEARPYDPDATSIAIESIFGPEEDAER